MLPGFRFLIAAVMLSLSLVVFGLGAVSLLRSAHEEFASVPIVRAPPETVFNQGYDSQPRLAMLRVDAPVQTARPAPQDAPIPAIADSIAAKPVDQPAATTDLKSGDLTSTDLALQPAPSATVPMVAAAPDASPTTAALPAVASAEPVAAPPTDVTANTIASASDPAPAPAPQPDAAAAPDAMASAPTVPPATPALSPAGTVTVAAATKPAATTPAPMVIAALAPDQTPTDGNNVTATTSGTASAPSVAAPSADATQVASLADPTSSPGDLVPSDPIPASMVPLPRHRPAATPKKMAEKKKKVTKPRRVAAVARTQTLPAVSSGSPFD